MAPKQLKPRHNEAKVMPNRDGIYPADTWRISNPGYEHDEPCSQGNYVQIDAATWYDYEQGLMALGAKSK